MNENISKLLKFLFLVVLNPTKYLCSRKVFVTFECAFERWCSSDFHKIHASFECFLFSDILVSPKDLIEILALRARTLRTHPYSTKSFDRTCVGVCVRAYLIVYSR